MSEDHHERMIRELDRLRSEVEELRKDLPRLDDQQFRAKVDALMARHRDPELHEVCWDWIEGKIDRRDLRVHPAYARAMREDWETLFEQMESRGIDPAEIGRQAREDYERQEEERDREQRERGH